MSALPVVANQRTYRLSDLLPYDPAIKKHKDLRTGLIEYQTVLTIFQQAVIDLNKGRLAKFDALVGENACEIRTIWIALIDLKCLVDVNIPYNQLVKIKAKVDSLLAPKTIASLMGSQESLKSILDKEELNIFLTKEEAIAVQTYSLSETKVAKEDKEKMSSMCKLEAAAPNKIKQFGNVSSSFAKAFTSKQRRLLATASVEFIREHAATSKDPSLTKMASKDFTVEHNTWPCIPMFWTYKVVLEVARKEGIPFVIHAKFLDKQEDGFKVVDEECLLLESTQGGQYAETAPSQAMLSRPVCVVEGVVSANGQEKLLSKEQWKAYIKTVPLATIILAGAADHRQYPDPKQDERINALKDDELGKYRELAKKEGFSLENPSRFFIQHVFANRVENIPLLAKQVSNQVLVKPSSKSL